MRACSAGKRRERKGEGERVRVGKGPVLHRARGEMGKIAGGHYYYDRDRCGWRVPSVCLRYVSCTCMQLVWFILGLDDESGGRGRKGWRLMARRTAASRGI